MRWWGSWFSSVEIWRNRKVQIKATDGWGNRRAGTKFRQEYKRCTAHNWLTLCFLFTVIFISVETWNLAQNINVKHLTKRCKITFICKTILLKTGRQVSDLVLIRSMSGILKWSDYLDYYLEQSAWIWTNVFKKFGQVHSVIVSDLDVACFSSCC